jgi:quercetin dioxygenase-like cupin family protein
MRVLHLGAIPGHPIAQFDSHAFTVLPIATGGETHLVTARLGPGGVIGRHRAVGRQILVVLEGQAVVSGDAGGDTVLEPGQAALWEPGENHEARTNQGLLALIVEGDLVIDPEALPPNQSD